MILTARQVVEAIERVGARGVLDRRQRRQRDHLALRRPDVDAADVVGPPAVRRLGRHQHLPRPAVLVEVVDVVGAERARERAVDLVDRHAELLRFLPVGVDVELRDGRAPQRLRAAELRIAVGAGEKCLRDFRQAFRAAFAPVLDVELEPSRRPQAEDRRRVEGEHQRLLDPHRPAEELADEARRGHLALVPRHLHDEERGGAVAEAAADEVEARERNDVLIGRVRADRFLHLLDDLVRALQRRAVGQEHRADVEALVLVGHEASRRGLPQPGGDRHHAGEQDDGDDPAPDQPQHAVGIMPRDAGEPVVEPREETTRRAMAVLQHQARTTPARASARPAPRSRRRSRSSPRTGGRARR